MRFDYQGVDESGTAIQGSIDAPDRRSAAISPRTFKLRVLLLQGARTKRPVKLRRDGGLIRILKNSCAPCIIDLRIVKGWFILLEKSERSHHVHTGTESR